MPNASITPWRRDPQQTASGKPGAVQFRASTRRVDEEMKAIGFLGRQLRDVPLWVALGVIFSLVVAANSDEGSPRSPFGFLEVPLFLLMIAGIWADRRFGFAFRIAMSRRGAAVAYVLLSWTAGMIYELTLTQTGEGVGGLHADTTASFLLGQGIYIPASVTSLIVIRWFRLSFREAFFYAAGFSLAEGLVFTGVLLATLLSPQVVLAPLMFAYYALVYGCILAMPLLAIDERLLWAAPWYRRKAATWQLVVGGFLIGLALNVLWGLVLGPLVEALFDLPPNRP